MQCGVLPDEISKILELMLLMLYYPQLDGSAECGHVHDLKIFTCTIIGLCMKIETYISVLPRQFQHDPLTPKHPKINDSFE